MPARRLAALDTEGQDELEHAGLDTRSPDHGRCTGVRTLRPSCRYTPRCHELLRGPLVAALPVQRLYQVGPNCPSCPWPPLPSWPLTSLAIASGNGRPARTRPGPARCRVCAAGAGALVLALVSARWCWGWALSVLGAARALALRACLALRVPLHCAPAWRCACPCTARLPDGPGTSAASLSDASLASITPISIVPYVLGSP
jgi:hypothetical protein